MSRIATAALRTAAACSWLAAATPVFAQTPQADFRARPARDEIVYFVLPDRFADGDASNNRGGLTGDRLITGYDPTDAGFFHGGDLKGLTERLDYIQGLGATAVWLAPVFANKPVQGRPGHESAGYHGYWITDFTRVDPHLGTNEDFRALVDAAHARGLKVYMDIVVNHTADVIKYRECPDGGCAYRGRGDYPYQRRGGLEGPAINDGFDGSNFEALTRPDYAYTPFIPEGEADAKRPAWLNDVTLYHNRGDSEWYGESALDGDFSGLDDVFTENPRVIEGFIQVYGDWIDRYGVDGFRIDTAKHVDPAFWRAFVPAMIERAAARGVPNFHIFGEVYGQTTQDIAPYTVTAGLPSVLDFAWQGAVQALASGKAGPDRLAQVIAADSLYAGGEATALTLPVFDGNHDMGRIGWLIQKDAPGLSDEELERRVRLAHALVMLGRGVPVIYYGDEQGLAGDGDDRRARQDMFDTRVPAYAAARRVGRASQGFDTRSDLYVALAEMARVRSADPRLRGGRVVVRRADREPGLLAISRLDATGETVTLFNTSTSAIDANIPVEVRSRVWRSALGACPTAAAAPGALSVSVPALGYVVCVSESSE